MWVTIFSIPRQPLYMNDPYPDLFKNYIISDYLSGATDEMYLEKIYKIRKTMILNWIY